MTIIISYLIFRIHFTSTFRNRISDSYADFTKCIFSHFDGTDESWERACGLHPSFRDDVLWYGWLMTVLSGQSVLVSIIYLSQPSVWSFWRTRYLSVKRDSVKVSTILRFIGISPVKRNSTGIQPSIIFPLERQEQK